VVVYSALKTDCSCGVLCSSTETDDDVADDTDEEVDVESVDRVD